MALPAGRYGVTKNQLLKIKKLPMNTIKLIEELTEKFDLLGTAAFKNSTSVVTDSSDLVESGAVYDALGFGNKNLFNPSYLRSDTVPGYVPVYVGNGTFTLSSNAPLNTTNGANLFLLAGIVGAGASTADNGVWDEQTRTVESANGYITIASRYFNGVNPADYNNQLEKGSTATAYEPYHSSVEQTLRDAEVIEGKNLYADEQDIQFGSVYNLRTKTIRLTKPLGPGTYTINVQRSEGTASITIQIRYNGAYKGVDALPYTFTVNSGSVCDSIYIYISQDDYDGGKSAVASKIQIEAGTEATDYEPYYTPLKDVVPTKADNSVIGTVEDGANPTKEYAVGEHMIRGGKFCTVTVPVTTSSTWTLGSNYVEGTIADELRHYLADATSNLSFVVNSGRTYIVFTRGGSNNEYSFVWLVCVNSFGNIYFIPLFTGTVSTVSISNSGNTITVTCSNATIVMGYVLL